MATPSRGRCRCFRRIAALETQILAWHKSSLTSQCLATIPGIGPIIATAIAGTVPDPGVIRSGREFAAWLGLVPRQNSTGGKDRLGRISKRGDGYLRRLLVSGTHAVLLRSKAGKADPLVGLAAQPQAAARRGHRFGEQNGAHGLGHHEPTGYLPACCNGDMSSGSAATARLEAFEGEET